MANKHNNCRHIMPDGDRCKSPALRGTNYCYFHSRMYRIKRDGCLSDAPVILPDLEDNSAIQLALNQIAAAIASDKISLPKAALLLRTLRLASDNLAQGLFLASYTAVENVCDSGDGEQIAADPA